MWVRAQPLHFTGNETKDGSGVFVWRQPGASYKAATVKKATLTYCILFYSILYEIV